MTTATPTLADLLRTASPAAFEVADALDDDARAALLNEIEVWLGGAKQTSRLPLLAWMDESAWPKISALATTALSDARELVRTRARQILDEAMLQMPEQLGPRALHVAFEKGYVSPRWPHPTQVAPPPSLPRFRFGGSSQDLCGFCHKPLHHLLTHGGFELATCLSCLGWSQPLGDYALSYRHDADGTPHPVDRLPEPLAPQFPTEPFIETSVALVDCGPRFWLQNWGTAHGANLNRVGGEPTWVQNEEIRPCRGCAMPMQVVLQLDSDLPQVGGRHFAFGSGGLLFVQVCAACRFSTMLWQCT